MKKIILVSSLFTLAVSLSFTVQAKIYKWKDSNGVTHYSARPPTQKKTITKVKDIEKKILFAAGKSKPSTNAIATKTTNQDKGNGQAPAESALKAPNKKMISYCKSQRTNLATLRSSYNTVWIDGDGTKKRLTPTDRKEKIKTIKKSITENCVGV